MSVLSINENNFVKITLGKTKLLFPQSEVQSLESINDLSANNDDALPIGKITYNDIETNVFDFNEHLDLVTKLSSSRKMCVCLKKDNVSYGIACDTVTRLTAKSIKIVEIPSCMNTDLCPVLGFGIKNESVYNIINTDTLNNIIINSVGIND